jgi:hypothetical protein
MAGRIRERDLHIPALRAAAAKPGGFISTTDLIAELEQEFEPDGEDADILHGRADTKFSQKVRNLISHKNTSTSIFTKGHATYENVNEGIRITDAGRALLAQMD